MLDLVFVRKIGLRHQPELAAAAVVDGVNPEIVRNEDVIRLSGITQGYLDRKARRELAEIERRREVCLRHRPLVPLDGRTLILVDDGIATGASARVALRALRRRRPKALILALPVAPPGTLNELRAEVDDLVCLETPEPFIAVGIHYRDFHQLSDDDVVRVLAATDMNGSTRAEGSAPALVGR